MRESSRVSRLDHQRAGCGRKQQPLAQLTVRGRCRRPSGKAHAPRSGLGFRKPETRAERSRASSAEASGGRALGPGEGSVASRDAHVVPCAWRVPCGVRGARRWSEVQQPRPQSPVAGPARWGLRGGALPSTRALPSAVPSQARSLRRSVSSFGRTLSVNSVPSRVGPLPRPRERLSARRARTVGVEACPRQGMRPRGSLRAVSPAVRDSRLGAAPSALGAATPEHCPRRV